jgi:hypothetical protein
MADIGWAPNYLPGITDLGWAIDNLAIFTTPGTYGSVVADFHAFYDYIAPYNPADFPTSYSSMASTWLGTGRIQEAQNDGIAIISTECGSKGSSAAKTGFTNQLTFYNAHYISYAGWIFLVRDTEGFSLISSLRWQSTTVAVWSTTGRILHQACLSAPQPKLRR